MHHATGLHISLGASASQTSGIEGVETLADPHGALPAAAPPEEAQDLAPGTAVGRYVIVDRLGAGGMGTVYRAFDPALDRDVALKVLHGDVNPARLGWEAKALARLRHPNVVTVLDIGSLPATTLPGRGTTEQAFFVMELVEGKTLREWLRGRSRSLAVTLEAFVACGRGLAAAHGAGIVHRDFKPDNVVVDRDGAIRVLDFGLAHWLDDVEARPLTIAGTRGYMAPEQMVGGLIDARADQFAFAVSLWESTVGRRPFAGTREEITAQVVSGRLPDIPASSRVPSWLERILRRGLAVDPARRFASMREVIAALEAGISRLGSASRVVADRYELLRGATDGLGARALDRLTGSVVTVVKRTADAEVLSLRHPNLVTVLEVGVDDDDAPYGILDLQEPPTPLRTALRGEPPARQSALLLGVLRALSHLHARGLVQGELLDEHLLVVAGQAKLVHLGPPSLVPRDGAAPVAPTPARDIAALMALLDPSALPAESREEPSVEDALSALTALAGRSLALETPETRESLLAAAPLAGRYDESAWIDGIVVDAAAGRGGAWLLVGESGVGKSRLLGELGRLAMTSGALVLTGQEQREGGRVHGLLGNVALRLAFDPELSDLEAAVLFALAPQLTTVLAREIPAAPTLDGSSVHARLVEVLVGLLARQTRTVVILLEDVHWSHADSLRLVEALARASADAGFLLVATCRDDAALDLPRALPSMRPRKLARLDTAAMEDMARGILGRTLPPGLADLLARETEGNAFFLVEVLRALADEAGSLHGIPGLDLPATVFAGGVQRLVQGRLARVPEPLREPLKVAAVIGRTLDLRLLAAVRPDVDLGAWLASCQEASVIEAHEGGHRFWHDKLREVLLEGDDAALAASHGEVARARVQLHPDDPAQWAALAHHFGRAGDAVEEARYAALAGEQSVDSGAFVEGQRLLGRALALAKEAGSTRDERARLERLLGEADYYGGNISGAIQHHTAALDLLGHRPPRSGAGWLLSIARQALVYIVLQRSSTFLRRDGARAERQIEASRSAGRLAFVFTYGMDSLAILGFGLMAVNLASRARKANVFALAFVAYALGCAGLRGASTRAYARAKVSAEASADWAGLLGVLLTESVLATSRCDFDAAGALLEEKLTLAERVGDRVGAANAEGVLAASLHLQGDIEGMTERYRRSHALVPAETGDHAALYAMGHAHGLTLLGRRDEARALLDACDARITADNRLARSRLSGTLAHFAALGGDLPAAVEHAAECLRHYRSGPAVDPVAVVVFEGPMEALCRSLEAAPEEGAATAALWKAARAHERQLALWTRVSPCGKALRTRFRGKLELIAGKHAAGCATLERAADEARALRMPFYEGLALLDLGRAQRTAGDAAVEGTLATARELLVRTSARAHLDELDAITSSG